MFGCRGHQNDPQDVLMKYGDQTITLEDVESRIPQGLSVQDSVALFNAILDGWVRDVVLAEFAEERLIDTERIDRKVRDYRNALIVEEYLRRIRESQNPKIDESQVLEYYEHHKGELKLEQPLVRGLYLRVNSEAKGREDIKNLISSDDPDKIDRLEREWLDRALDYKYFRDKWIDWESLSRLMPSRLPSPETLKEDSLYFEMENEDCVYYLQLTDILPAGETQPFEYARAWIIEMLTQGNINDYEDSLVESLVEKSIKDNKLEIVGYDPVSHELIRPQ
ncbi:MAG: hypothetical protein J1D77_06775 [Muribaculaceae bacterium]|nr:hypothetical protein [Muribaculaceae bacterium]